MRTFGLATAAVATALGLGLPAAAPAAAAAPLDFLPALAGAYFPIDSRETGHRYHVYIRYPEGYDEQPDRRYPVLYLLDGDSLFPHLASNQLFIHYDDKLPDAIVVGIAYGSFDAPQNRRRHDFTVGAAAFDRFLQNELIPRVERETRADPERRILFGQSRGGGYVLHSAFTNPDLFWGRVASNPTLDLLPSLTRPPASAQRRDLHLLVVSGALDQPRVRQPLVEWFATWGDRRGLPWALRTETLADGTHAADSARAHRMAMRWLFRPATP